MTDDNLQKKEQIDDVLATYTIKVEALKQKRDRIITDFLENLKEKKLEELRNSIQQS